MKVLKSLTFGVMSRGSQNPVLARRAKLIHRLEQQKKLAQDANFVVTVSKWLRNEAGSKELIGQGNRPRPNGAAGCCRGREPFSLSVSFPSRLGARVRDRFDNGSTRLLGANS